MFPRRRYQKKESGLRETKKSQRARERHKERQENEESLHPVVLQNYAGGVLSSSISELKTHRAAGLRWAIDLRSEEN